MRGRLTAAVGWLAARWPRVAYRIAPGLGFLTLQLRRGVTEAQIRSAFPQLGPGEVRAVRRRAWANEVREWAMDAAMRSAKCRDPYPAIVPSQALSGVGAPVIFAAFHAGPLAVLGKVLAELPGDVVALHRNRWREHSRVTLLNAGDDDWARARAFHTAVLTLRSGGYVFVAVDGYNPSTVEATLLGRTVWLARGAFALARISGAPIVPLAVHWNGAKAETVLGDPIPFHGTEEATAAATTRWFEAYLRRHPGEVSRRTIELLAGTGVDRAVDQKGAQVGVADLPVRRAGNGSWRDNRDAARREA